MMRKLILLYFFCFINCLCAFTQEQIRKESLVHQLKTAGEDTAAVDLYYNYGETIENDNPDSAAYYYKKAKALAEKIKFNKGVAAFSSHYIVILNNEGKFREALSTAQEALEIYKKIGDKKDLAVAYLNVGSEWEYLSDFEQAAAYYLIAKKYADEINDKKLQRISANNMASVFIEMGDYKKGKQYAEGSLAIAKELNDYNGITASMYNIATAQIKLQQPDKALALYKEIETIGEKHQDNMRILDGWLGMADAYSALNNFANAEANYDKVISFSKAQNTPEYEMYACMGMADVLLKSKTPADAFKYIFDGIDLATEMKSKLELKDLYLKASLMYEKKGDAASALKYRKQFETLNDSIVGEKNQTHVLNIEAKYEFEKKENTIKELQVENKLRNLTISRKNTLNYILICSAAALVIILLLGYRNYTHRQKLQQAKIDELETEKQLSATEAVLKGEEQERTRLAKDLHDGLGGMLSGIKYSLSNMKENLIMTPDNAQAFERSIDMLDSSIKEMRRVAHNMMPEVLVKYGLNTALKDFCNEMERTGVIKINYQPLNMEHVSMEQIVELTVYRIVQELVNNAIKHAQARQVLVQLHFAEEERLLAITVEDDGKGFDTTLLKTASGIGWDNIRNRVDFLKGKADIKSVFGKGTSVLIEINI